MKRENQFDEVMIVNPSQGRTNSDQRVRLMRFHNVYPPELSGYAEPDLRLLRRAGAYGYYGEVEPTVATTVRLIRPLVTTVKSIRRLATTARLIRRSVTTVS